MAASSTRSKSPRRKLAKGTKLKNSNDGAVQSSKSSETKKRQFRLMASAYVCLLVVFGYGIYNLFRAVFPAGLGAEKGCEHFWEALGLASSSDPNFTASFSRRVGMVWDCGENVRGYGALSIYACLWICLKALAIPGSMILCVALGGLVPPLQAQVIASVCEVLGGSLCYLLSGIIGEPLLQRFSPVLLAKFRTETELRRQRGDLFYFALWARQTPLIPNWLVNAASPIAGIPYSIFISTMFIGIQIATFLSIRTGAMLFALGRNSSSGDSLLNGQAIQNFIILLVAQFIAVIPLYLNPKKDIGEVAINGKDSSSRKHASSKKASKSPSRRKRA